MMTSQIHSLSGISFVAAKARAYFELLKFRLSILVAFSCAFGYVLGSPSVKWLDLTMLFIGGLLLSGASGVINQIKEIQYDSLMVRTQNRPLTTQRLSVQEACVFGIT